MSATDAPAFPAASSLQAVLAARVRALRAARGMTLRQLARDAGLSLRLLSLVEAGTANPTLGSMEGLARALGVDVIELLTRARDVRPVALLGLRGAGKSTIGAALAARLVDDEGPWDFVELDALLERESGLSLGALFELHGEPHVRALEARVLGDLLSRTPRCVIATGGGIVTSVEAWRLLRARTTTVWLKATPQEHWDRVRAQGDHRPMARRNAARAELDALWHARAPLYAQATVHVDTSTLSVERAVEVIREAIGAAISDAPRPA